MLFPKKKNVVNNILDLKKLKDILSKKNYKLDGDLNKLIFSIISVNVFLDNN